MNSTEQVLLEVQERRRAWGPQNTQLKRLLTDPASAHSARLTALQILAGNAAEDLIFQDRSDAVARLLVEDVLDVAVGAFAWLQCICRFCPAERLLDQVRSERRRQDRMWGAGCAETTADVWMTVLAEEIGEVAKAINDIRAHGTDAEQLIRELIEVCAVAVFWLEQLPLPQRKASVAA